jgi:hypothetical protein
MAMPRFRELDPRGHGRGHRGAARFGAWSLEGDAQHDPDVAMEPDRHHLHKLALTFIVKSVALLWALSSGGSLARPQSAARIARSENARGPRAKLSMPDRCRIHLERLAFR